jgi:hypothetical protein
MKQPEIRQVKEGQMPKCPHCGTALAGKPGRPACEHVRFVYLGGEGFDYADPNLLKELGAEQARAEAEDGFFDEWEALKAHTGPGSMIIEQNEEDGGCGPNTFTVWVGIGPAKRRQRRSAPAKHTAKAKRRSRG